MPWQVTVCSMAEGVGGGEASWLACTTQAFWGHMLINDTSSSTLLNLLFLGSGKTIPTGDPFLFPFTAAHFNATPPFLWSPHVCTEFATPECAAAGGPPPISSPPPRSPQGLASLHCTAT